MCKGSRGGGEGVGQGGKGGGERGRASIGLKLSEGWSRCEMWPELVCF